MNKFNYYVIHFQNNKIRLNNIQNMQKKIFKEINIFFGVNGSLVNTKNLKIYDPNIKIKKQLSNLPQLGCYLSHYLLIKSLIDSDYEYTVIFEDDFNILIPDLDYKINHLLDTIDIDFDFLFLGTLSNSYGKHYKDDIYFINKTNKICGFHAYIINNKNITKILSLLNDINFEVDIQIFNHIKNNNLIGLFINPNYVSQNDKIISLLRKNRRQSIIQTTRQAIYNNLLLKKLKKYY